MPGIPIGINTITRPGFCTGFYSTIAGFGGSTGLNGCFRSSVFSTAGFTCSFFSGTYKAYGT